MISALHLLEHQFDQRKGGVENFVRYLKQKDPGFDGSQGTLFKSTLEESYSLLEVLKGRKGCEVSHEEFGKGLCLSDDQKPLSSFHLIHIHQILPYGLLPLIKLISKKPSVFTLHDYFPFCQRVHFFPYRGEICSDGPSNLRCSLCVGSYWRLPALYGFFKIRKLLVHKFLTALSAIIIPNEDLLSLLPSEFRSKTKVIPYAVPKAKTVANEESETYIFVGTLAEHKGIHSLMRELEACGFQGKIDLYGPDPSGTLPSYLPHFASYKGLLKDRSIMGRYKALIMPSIWKETGPLVVLEALEEGLPVIARKGSISSTYSKSSAIHFFSHAKEIQGLKIRRPVQRIEGLPDLEEVKAMHHKLYARVWESWQVRYNNSRSNEKRSNHG